MDHYNSLYSAVREGRLERTRELINSFGLSGWSDGYTLLELAVYHKQTAVVKLLLESGSKVNIYSRLRARSPLHTACENGDVEIVKMLLDKHAIFGDQDGNGRTPLHTAIANEQMELFKEHLKQTADVNTGENDGTSPRHVEIEIKCLQIVEHLLNYGAYVNLKCGKGSWTKGYTPLHLAVEKGSKALVTLLLSRGADVDIQGDTGKTPLFIATEQGYIHIAEDLLKHGASINSGALYEQYTPLHFASRVGNEKAVKLLLANGACVNAMARGFLTPLHFALTKGRKIIVKLLLQHGAKVDFQDREGKTTLHLAVEKGDLTIVEDVLRHCPDINDKSNRSSLKVAVQRSGEQYKKIVQALLEYGFTVGPKDANNPKLLHAAVEKGCLKILKDLLKYGADVNTPHKGFTILHIAVKNKHEEIAKLLISCSAYINAHDVSKKTPIFYAIENADLKMTSLLLTNRASIKDSPDLLNFAVKKQCIEIVKTLLQHGADVNDCDQFGRTALYFTALSECLNRDINIKREIAKLLLSKGARVDAQTINGETALHAAIKNGYVKVVEDLLKYNANVNSGVKSDGNTSLHLSAHGGNEEIITMLLNKGANVNAKQKDGITALHIATEKGQKEVVQLLLEHGANVDSKMKSGSTPLHLGAKKGYKQIIETLLKFGAYIDSKDEDGRTALHIASQHERRVVVFTLLEYGSNINITCRNDRTPLDYAMAGRYPLRFVYSRETIAKSFKRQVVKMKAANLYVSEQNLLSISSIGEISGFQEKCEEEIARMKNEKINNHNISFYDILAKCTRSLEIHMRNDNRLQVLVQVFKSGDYKICFPIYASMIDSQFRKAMERKHLLEQGNKSFHFLCNNFPQLPYDCTEKIYSYLSNEDLRILMDACKPQYS